MFSSDNAIPTYGVIAHEKSIVPSTSPLTNDKFPRTADLPCLTRLVVGKSPSTRGNGLETRGSFPRIRVVLTARAASANCDCPTGVSPATATGLNKIYPNHFCCLHETGDRKRIEPRAHYIQAVNRKNTINSVGETCSQLKFDKLLFYGTRSPRLEI